jgi:hypothetical protein
LGFIFCSGKSQVRSVGLGFIEKQVTRTNVETKRKPRKKNCHENFADRHLKDRKIQNYH